MCVWRGVVAQMCPTLRSPQTIACKAPLSMEFSRQEFWSGLPFPCLGDHSDSGIKPRSPALQVDTLPSEPPGKPIYIKFNYLFGCTWFWSWHLRSLASAYRTSSLSRDGTPVPCTGSVEPQPLDHEGSPQKMLLLKELKEERAGIEIIQIQMFQRWAFELE